MKPLCCIANGAFDNVVQTIARVFFIVYYAYLKTEIPKCKSVSHFRLMGKISPLMTFMINQYGKKLELLL